MPDRRTFLHTAAAAGAGLALPAALRAGEAARPRFDAIAFDGFPIFDPRPIAALAEASVPGRGAALMNAWRVRQFEYQWLRALAGQYVDFRQATADSLDFASAQLQLDLGAAAREALLSAWANLRPWPDAAAALRGMHAAGLRLVFLSNMTAPMLEHGLRAAGLDSVFEAVISTDRIRSYKPDPRAYQLGSDVLRLPKERILFVAFAGWDVAGAKWFGYPTFWLNRANAPGEVLGVVPDGAGSDMAALLRFVLGTDAAAIRS